ncbi:hypothetical protein [Rhizobium sp. L245/93]|uniref:hypothetical protein n=1 Tax=Rhizobium sp. L245/93 TaxID=2819998 RepID=UPI001ADB493A|nr:hypothetical protein [Rhizobium sp. L245/93]MBO9168422.1 hypothetical protein [Rhizobium sp. L245/93]
MPNNTIQAAAEGMPKFSRQSVMSEAWSIYRRETRSSRPSRPEGRRKLFAQCLRNAWAWAKQRLVDSMKTIQQRAVERVRELTVELMQIDGRPWKMRATGDRCAIQAELDAQRALATH